MTSEVTETPRVVKRTRRTETRRQPPQTFRVSPLTPDEDNLVRFSSVSSGQE